MKLLIYGFNKACSNIAASHLKVRDESMSAIQFRTTSKGDLPHLSYISCNPEPLGAEFNTVACSVTGSLLFLEIQCGGVGDEVDPVSFGVGRHSRLYQEIDGRDQGAGAEGRERFNKGLFHV